MTNWFSDWTSWAWLAIFIAMAVLEFYTLVIRKEGGDTLSEHLRRLLGLVKDPTTGTYYKGYKYGIVRAIFLLFFVWFIVHIFTGLM